MSVTDEVRRHGSPGGPEGVERERGYDRAGGEHERTPPQDVAAEQCVLGGMMLSKDAIADVIEILRSSDFYRPAHATIFDAILDLYGRGDPADAITVAAALTDAGDLGRVGGATYLHTLISSVPTAANSAYYARIVAERAVLRRLVEAGTRVVQLGYGSAGHGRDVDDVVDLAQQAVYDVTERRAGEDFAILAELLQPALDEIEALGSHDGAMTGVPTGFGDLDRLLNGLHPGQLVVVAGRPGLGKSTASMDFARSASVRHNLPSAIFSLEMSKIEIVTRLLSAEARVPLHVLRSGQLSDDDWTRLARRMGEISEAPIFIDDTPNMTLMEIRAKARRLRQRHELKLVIVDYLQLMTSPKRVENRQQEVADLSRGLKLLAKEIECPVVAVSQLNRGPEQRTDKRPQLSDLRESGCLIASTRLLRADTNTEVTLGELLASNATDVAVWALDERLRCVPRTLTHAFPSGRRMVYRMRLASGKEIEATGNHRFLTVDGWRPLEQLARGGRIAAPRHVPAPLEPTDWPADHLIRLAHRLGDPSGVRRDQIRHGSVDGLGLFDLRSHERPIPPAVFGLRKPQLALFLRHLWAMGGSATMNTPGADGRIYLRSTSRRLLLDVAMLLLRFGITAHVNVVSTDGRRAQYTVDVSGRDDQIRFLTEIGVHGAREVAWHLANQSRAQIKSNTGVHTIPKQVWSRVRDLLSEPGMTHLSEPGMTHREFSGGTGTRSASARSGGSMLGQQEPRRSGLARIAALLDAADLDLHATNDVIWDEIVSIGAVGERDVFDATVLGVHNFIANGIACHNSIEQDADVVILLHRDDYYDRESPRAGEADFIVAKQRNGPTGTVTVAAQLHFSRFVDMAIS